VATAFTSTMMSHFFNMIHDSLNLILPITQNRQFKLKNKN